VLLTQNIPEAQCAKINRVSVSKISEWLLETRKKFAGKLAKKIVQGMEHYNALGCTENNLLSVNFVCVCPGLKTNVETLYPRSVRQDAQVKETLIRHVCSIKVLNFGAIYVC
jgi:hypothetical protein